MSKPPRSLKEARRQAVEAGLRKPQLLDVGQMCGELGISRARFYECVAEDLIPAPVRLPSGEVRWRFIRCG